MYDPFTRFQSVTLKNGLQVHILHEPGVTFEHVRFIVRTGSFDEPVAIPGIAHFTEHVVCSASGKTVAEIGEFFEGEGAEFTAYTDHFSTVYGFSSALSSLRFQEFADFIGNSMLRPRFEHVVERERGAILSEFGRRYRSEKEISFRLATSAALLPETPFANKLGGLGTKESVKALSVAQLYAFQRAHYTPQNISVVCVGGMDMAQVLTMLERSGFCDHTANADLPTKQLVSLPTESPQRLLEGDFTHDGITTSSTCTWYWLVVSSQVPMRLYTRILTHQLMNALRGNERSIVYGTHAGYEDFRDFFCLAVAAKDFSHVHEAVVAEIVLQQVNRVPLQEELFHLKKKAAILTFARTETTLETVCDQAVSNLARFGYIKTMEERMSNIQSASFEDVLDIAKQMKEHNSLQVLERY